MTTAKKSIRDFPAAQTATVVLVHQCNGRKPLHFSVQTRMNALVLRYTEHNRSVMTLTNSLMQSISGSGQLFPAAAAAAGKCSEHRLNCDN